MNLHENKTLFSDLIRTVSDMFDMDEVYVEKDYWITRSLQRMSQNVYAERVVFKGGTSLSKAYRLSDRFSEDIDVAVVDADSISGNQLKTLIKRLAKDMAGGLEENVVSGVTSKGSRFYKAVYIYPNLVGISSNTVKAGQLLIEINTFANPYPYVKRNICSFITDYITTINRNDLIARYRLQPFTINVLDKRRTMIEKLASLFRFSFSSDPCVALASKIRHFYDLYYLAKDEECSAYMQTSDFKREFSELLAHDQKIFDTPENWKEKKISQSSLVADFPALWIFLRNVYSSELPKLAFAAVPDERDVAKTFVQIMERLNS
jgi:hypothetical protein